MELLSVQIDGLQGQLSAAQDEKSVAVARVQAQVASLERYTVLYTVLYVLLSYILSYMCYILSYMHIYCLICAEKSVAVALVQAQVASPYPLCPLSSLFVFFFFITLKPRVELYTSQ